MVEEIKIQTYKNSIETIKILMTSIIERKYILQKFYEFVAENPELKNNDFLNIMIGNYLDLLVIDVCKIGDTDGRSESLINLLKDVNSNKELFSLGWFEKCWKHVAKDEYKQFSYKDKKDDLSISTDKINEDIEKIEHLLGVDRIDYSNSLNKLRDKRLAHYDKGRFSTQITVNKLYEIIDGVEKIVMKYNMLINQEHYKFLPGNIDEFVDFEDVIKIEK